MSANHTDFVAANSSQPPPPEKPADAHQKRRRRVSQALQKRRSVVAERTMADIRSSFVVRERPSLLSVTPDSNPYLNKKVEQKPPLINLTEDDDNDSSSTIDLTRPDKPLAPPPPVQKKRKKESSEPRVSINDWPGLTEMAKNTGIWSVTCVDPGTRNFALLRMEFYPTLRITHVRVLDFDVLAIYYQEKYNVKLKSEGAKFTIDAHLVVLQDYIECDIKKDNGCFNSSMVIVEEQSFDRNMARVEACVQATVNSLTNPLRLNADNRIPRCQVSSSKSIKSCYRPLFPDLSDDEERPKKKSRKQPFGMGDVRGNSTAEEQRLFNKKNAIKSGRLMLEQRFIKNVVPAANLTADDRERVLKAKCDDLYDCLFMALYFGSCYLFHYNKMKTFSNDEKFVVTAAPPQRPHNCYEEIFEVCAAIGTPAHSVQSLVNMLLKETGETIDINEMK